VLTVTVTGEDGPRPVADAALRVSQRLAEQRGFLGERYQSIFADYLIRDLAERLRGQIEVAEDLCRRMKRRARSRLGRARACMCSWSGGRRRLWTTGPSRPWTSCALPWPTGRPNRTTCCGR